MDAQRQELIKNALTFLQDPKSQTQSSSLSQRIQFLEQKGLTPLEIDLVLKQSGTSTPASSMPLPYSPPYPVPYGNTFNGPPPRTGMDWRDYFIVAVVSGTLVAGAVTLARKYVLPHLRPPPVTSYEADKDALTAQFDAAEALLKEIQTETLAMKEAVDLQKSKIDATAQEVHDAVQQIKEDEAKSRDEIREVREEVEAVRDMIPRMFDKSKEAHSQSLAELQQELKSLKALLSRGSSFAPSTPGVGAGITSSFKPSIPSWQLASDATLSPSSSNANLTDVPSTLPNSVPSNHNASMPYKTGDANP